MRLLQRDVSSLTLNSNDPQMSNVEPYLQGLLVELWVVGQLVKLAKRKSRAPIRSDVRFLKQSYQFFIRKRTGRQSRANFKTNY